MFGRPHSTIKIKRIISMNSGIYIITNNQNGNQYIGSSNNLYGRESYHKTALVRNYHHNQHLQRAYNKYGEDIFEFRIIIYCDPANLILFEQRFMDFYKPKYNMNPKAESCAGRVLSEEHKRKIGDAHKGMIASKETKRKLSLARRGKIPWNKGKKMSSESRKKMRIAALKDGRRPPLRSCI